MNTDKTKKVLKVGAVAIVGALIGVGGAGLTIDTHETQYMDAQSKITSLNQDISSLNHTLEVKDNLIEVLEQKECPVPQTYSDEDYLELSAKLDAVMNYVEDEVDEDIDVEYVLFEVGAEFEAEKWIEESFIDWLKDEDYFDDGELLDNYRKSEVSIKRIYDVEKSEQDYEDKDIVLDYEVKLRAKESGEDKEYFNFIVSIPFQDGLMEAEDVEVEVAE